jgi:hypothetical protein
LIQRHKVNDPYTVKNSVYIGNMGVIVNKPRLLVLMIEQGNPSVCPWVCLDLGRNGKEAMFVMPDLSSNHKAAYGAVLTTLYVQ